MGSHHNTATINRQKIKIGWTVNNRGYHFVFGESNNNKKKKQVNIQPAFEINESSGNLFEKGMRILVGRFDIKSTKPNISLLFERQKSPLVNSVLLVYDRCAPGGGHPTTLSYIHFVVYI